MRTNGPARWGRRGAALTCMAVIAVGATRAAAETVTFDLSSAPSQVVAGTTLVFNALITDNLTDQFIGYSLDVDVAPMPGATGSITGLTGDLSGLDPSQSNFFVSENFIEADPAGTLHPVASVINDGGDGGIFVRALEETFTPVGPAGPGHNVLAELRFEVSPDALGFFTIELDMGTELLDAAGAVAPFNTQPVVVEVIPEPGTLALLALSAVLVTRRGKHSQEWR